ncbi:MAG: serpin family protein [Microcoleaceae cyanobacterium]
MVVSKLVPAYERFSFQLLSQLARQDANKNVFVSPMSVAITLAMAYNGARGTTEQAIAKVLGLEGLSLQEINTANQLLLSMGSNLDPQIQLEFANSLWVNQGTLDDDFVQRLRVNYLSEVANLNFANPEAATTINRWVAEKTKDKIKELVEPIQLINAILVLLNAIYFKGIWTQQFDKERTKEQNFILPDGSLELHPMMSQFGEYSYYERKEFQAVSLPYGNGRVSMYIFLPKPSSSIAEFQTLLTAENWQSWMSRFDKTKGYKREGDIVLPRFKVEYNTILNDALIALGMGVAFSGAANFAGMGMAGIGISEAIHKAVIEVNEEGAEAAAATALVFTISAPSRFRMIVERPFFHAIRDNQTGALLFMGFVLNPASN